MSVSGRQKTEETTTLIMYSTVEDEASGNFYSNSYVLLNRRASNGRGVKEVKNLSTKFGTFKTTIKIIVWLYVAY